jgi:hypothetical protein
MRLEELGPVGAKHNLEIFVLNEQVALVLWGLSPFVLDDPGSRGSKPELRALYRASFPLSNLFLRRSMFVLRVLKAQSLKQLGPDRKRRQTLVLSAPVCREFAAK